jgi:hypothetical protein
MLLQEKQPTETPLKSWARYNGRTKRFLAGTLVKSVIHPNGHRQLGVGIPRYSKKIHRHEIWLYELQG